MFLFFLPRFVGYANLCWTCTAAYYIGGYMTMEFCFNINETKGYSKCLPHFSLCICYYYWDYYFCNWPSSISFLISFTSSSQLFLFVFCSGWTHVGLSTLHKNQNLVIMTPWLPFFGFLVVFIAEMWWMNIVKLFELLLRVNVISSSQQLGFSYL